MMKAISLLPLNGDVSCIPQRGVHLLTGRLRAGGCSVQISARNSFLRHQDLFAATGLRAGDVFRGGRARARCLGTPEAGAELQRNLTLVDSSAKCRFGTRPVRPASLIVLSKRSRTSVGHSPTGNPRPALAATLREPKTRLIRRFLLFSFFFVVFCLTLRSFFSENSRGGEEGVKLQVFGAEASRE